MRLVSETPSRRARPAVRRAVAWCVATFGGLILVVALAEPAPAHTFLVRTSPPQGARLDGPPREVSLEFSEPVSAAAVRMGIRTSAEDRAVLTEPDPSEDGRVLTTPFAGRESGIFVVSWSVVADDGHQSAGEFAFAVGPVGGSLPAASSSGAPAGAAVVLTAVLFFAGMSLRGRWRSGSRVGLRCSG